jgi:hypothetical protein
MLDEHPLQIASVGTERDPNADFVLPDQVVTSA